MAEPRYEIPRSELVRIAHIAAEESGPLTKAAVLRAAENVPRVAFGASWVGEIACLGTAAKDFGRPEGPIHKRELTFNGPVFDSLVQAYLGGRRAWRQSASNAGVAEVVD